MELTKDSLESKWLMMMIIIMKMKNMTPTAYRALARVDLVKKEAAS